ncbi:MAG TPA: glycosyltransferase family 4 protein [Tepidisphaeraceae bacterium]|nr:glycosyltransferase family 4 protein [Tepidisphaeraceae bacterium]
MSRRILLFITDLEIGGTPTVVRELATRLHDPAAGAEIEVGCLAPWGPVADQIRAGGIEVTALGITSRFRIGRAVRKLRELVRERKIDVVFSFLVHANAVAAKARAAAAGELQHVRWLQSIQTTQPRPRWHWWVQRRIAPAAEKVVVPSPSAATVARERAGVPAEKVVVIPNAVDVCHFSAIAAEREAYLSRRHSAERAWHVGFLGRLDPVKRVEDLIHAIRRLADGSPLTHYQLHVFGDGALRPKLESLARAVLSPQVEYKFHGTVDTPGEALKQMDLLVLPSVAEGFGLVLIEAMATGVPVVATDVMGIRDVVAHERTGLLVPPCAPQQLADAIRRMCEDGELRRRMIVNGCEEVRRRYSWEFVLPEYRKLLGLAPSPATSRIARAAQHH